MQLEQISYAVIAEILYARTGIHLGDNKISLVESRLQKRLVQLGMTSWSAYSELLKQGGDYETDIVVEALTTHKTDWFRDAEHYDVLLQAAKSCRENFMVWSAASSTGEEAYSAALALAGAGRKPDCFRILGTDISANVVKTANSGIYRWGHGTESLGLFQHLIDKSEDGRFRVKPKVKSSVKFRTLNLMTPDLPRDLKFDIVFLRNVLIYFNEGSTRTTLENVMTSMKPGAFLVLGLSETLRLPHPNLKALGRSVHQFVP